MPDQKLVENELSNAIEAAVASALENGTIQQIIDDHVSKMLKDVVGDACRWGKVRDAMRAKVDDLFIPVIEKYDLAACNVKLEMLLDQLIEESAVEERRKILENARLLTSSDNVPDDIDLEWLFNKYCDFVSSEFDCSGREVEDGCYNPIHVEATVERTSHPHSLFEEVTVTFAPNDSDDPNDECERLAKSFHMSRYKSTQDDGYLLDGFHDLSIHDLKTLDMFDTVVATVASSAKRISADTWDDKNLWTDVVPDAEPELV